MIFSKIAQLKQSTKHSMSRWYISYFILMGVMLGIVCLVIHLNQRLFNHYNQTVDLNIKWSQRLVEAYELEQLVLSMNAPGNDVFESNDPKKELHRFQSFLASYLKQIQVNKTNIKYMERYIASAKEHKTYADLLSILKMLSLNTAQMNKETSAIFHSFSQKNHAKAALHMAHMDRLYKAQAEKINNLETNINQMNELLVQKSAASINELKQGQYLTLLIILIIISASIFFSVLLISKIKKEAIVLEYSLKERQAIFDTVIDGIISIDKVGTIRAFNHAAEQIFGYLAAEVIGSNINILMPEPDHTQHDDYLRNYLKTGVGKIIGIGREVIAKRKNGELFPMDLGISHLQMEHETMFVGLVRDITSRKKNEDELIMHRDHLQVLVSEQTKDILQAKKLAEEANHSKSEFLANMSHELRTPMHAILSYSDMGLKSLSQENPNEEKMKKYFSNIGISGTRLLSFLNNLLDLSKMESGTMELKFEHKDFSDVVDHVLLELESLINVKKVSVVVNKQSSDTTAYFDYTRMIQVMINLCSNAIKFSLEEKTITIKIWDCLFSEETQQQALCFSVANEGELIPETELEMIFKKFIQSSKTKTGAGGTGLGLSICKEIIAAHKGRIWAENSEPSSVVFTCIIPKLEQA